MEEKGQEGYEIIMSTPLACLERPKNDRAFGDMGFLQL